MNSIPSTEVSCIRCSHYADVGGNELLQVGFSWSERQRQKDPATGYSSGVHSVQSYGALISTADLITFWY